MYKRVTTDCQPLKSEVVPYQEKLSNAKEAHPIPSSRNGEMFTQISRSVDMDLPMQLQRPVDNEAPLKIPSSSRRALEASSFLFDREEEEELVRKPDASLGPILLPEPPKLSRYS